MKIVNGFVWKVITSEQAEVMFGHIELFELHENGTESLIEDIEILLLRIKQEVVIGIEVGKIDNDISRNCLETEGYFVENLWNVNDVKRRFECTNEQAQTILHNSLHNEWICEQIDETIRSEAEEMGLSPIETEED